MQNSICKDFCPIPTELTKRIKYLDDPLSNDLTCSREDRQNVRLDRLRKVVDDFFGRPMNLNLTDDGKRLNISQELLDQGLKAERWVAPLRFKINQKHVRKQGFKKKQQSSDTHCNTLKPHLFAAFPSLHPFFYFAPFCLQKDDIKSHKRGRTGAKKRHGSINFTIMSYS